MNLVSNLAFQTAKTPTGSTRVSDYVVSLCDPLSIIWLLEVNSAQGVHNLETGASSGGNQTHVEDISSKCPIVSNLTARHRDVDQFEVMSYV